MKFYDMTKTERLPRSSHEPAQGLNYLNTEQVAFVTGLSVSFFEKARVRGDGPPYIKVGKRVVYASKHLDAWLEERAARSTSDLVACNDNFLARLKAVRHG
ncbi:MAG TPA: helix-turn-helix domain-containing protein [Xanthobacteraceae bacterium]|nr:helix-turn-helix domain-containing protein [Xanthobacteraceae bacterium]